jgi:hypothetical protein
MLHQNSSLQLYFFEESTLDLTLPSLVQFNVKNNASLNVWMAELVALFNAFVGLRSCGEDEEACA